MSTKHTIGIHIPANKYSKVIAQDLQSLLQQNKELQVVSTTLPRSMGMSGEDIAISFLISVAANILTTKHAAHIDACIAKLSKRIGAAISWYIE